MFPTVPERNTPAGVPSEFRRLQVSFKNILLILQVLTFDADRLRQNLRFCWPEEVTARNDEEEFDDFEDATNLVKCLWPGWRLPLEEERSLLQRYTGITCAHWRL